MIEIRNLKVSVPAGKLTREIVHGISMDIPAGGWVCLVGESGSGKTLAALSLTRLIPGAEVAGSVLWREEGQSRDLLKVSEQDLRGIRGKTISYIFQDPHTSLNPVMRVGEQMTETYMAHYRSKPEEAKRAALASLAEVHLSQPHRVFDSYPYELSGGMKQRVMIAMALILGPRFLIADEPTTALDVTIERGIIDLLKDIRTEWPFGMLFITHNIVLASEVADRIYVMKDGHIVEDLSRTFGGFVPKSAYAQALFKAALHNIKPKTEIVI